MALGKEQVVRGLLGMVPAERMITDEEELRKFSVDRFLKFPDVFGVYPMPTPAALVYVESAGEVSRILQFCNENLVNVVPRTGASSIEGGLETAVENSVVLDGSRMDKILKIDPANMQVTAQCGVILEELENKLREMGYTTGHSPQSKPLAQMGGLVATRSTGQFSTLYGGIEDMVVGLEAVFPNGNVCRIKNVPRRAAGPDIRAVVIGSEGALCFVTEVTVKLFPYMPENNRFYSWVMHDMQTGFKILREVMVSGYRPSFTRLYDFEDGAYYFSHFSENKPVLIFMVEGPAGVAGPTGDAIEAIVEKYPTYKRVDEKLIDEWYAGLNWHPRKVEEERQEIAATHNVGFTTEISSTWERVYDIYEVCVRRVRAEIPDITLIGGHSSHSYINGTNIYFMYYYDVKECKPEDEIKKYHDPINQIIVEETLRLGGSMTHHHGVGKHRTKWIEQDYGSSYYILKTLKDAFDPNGIMNRGTVWPFSR